MAKYVKDGSKKCHKTISIGHNDGKMLEFLAENMGVSESGAIAIMINMAARDPQGLRKAHDEVEEDGKKRKKEGSPSDKWMSLDGSDVSSYYKSMIELNYRYAPINQETTPTEIISQDDFEHGISLAKKWFEDNLNGSERQN